MHRPLCLPARLARVATPRRWLAGVAACLAVLAQPALALPDQQSLDLGKQLAALQERLQDPANSLPARDLIESAGLMALLAPQAAPNPNAVPDAAADPAAAGSLFERTRLLRATLGQPGATRRTEPLLRAAEPAAGPVEVERLNMRLALTMLSQAYGAEDNYDVLQAQTAPGQQALVIRKGRVGLADLRRILQDRQPQRAGPGSPLVVNLPLIIWAGASLRLGAGETLALSRPDGAFIMNFGHLRLEGATITSVGAANPRSRHFIPFVTTADGGTVDLQGATLRNLGFGITLKFSGFSVMRNSLRVAEAESRIADSRFEDLVSVSVSAANAITLAGNRFHDMRGAALIVSRTRGATITGNLFSGAMPTNAIRIEDGSDKGRVSGNVVLGGERAGILVRNHSRGVQVERNIVWRRDGGGITLNKSDCGLILGNLVFDNRQKGIEVRTSRGAAVQGNTILSNHNAGIWVSAQPKDSETRLQGNILAENGAGLSAAVGEVMLLEGNDFSRQYPQFLSGDLAVQSGLIARDIRGEVPLILTAGGRADPARSAPAPSDACSD